jgi:hypothetical protein
MEISTAEHVQDFGLLLDIIGVFLVAKYQIPSEVLYPDGTESLEVRREAEIVTTNIKRFKKLRLITFSAYLLIAIGFLLQSNQVKLLMQ